MPIRHRALLLAVPCTAALAAGDLDGHFSNQSSAGPVTLTLCQGCAEAGDVLFALLDPPDGAARQRPAPVRLKGADRRQSLAPGQTAVLTLTADPAPGTTVQRHFHVTQAGQPGCFGFTLQASIQDGMRVTEVRADAAVRADLAQADSDLLVFWGFRPAGE